MDSAVAKETPAPSYVFGLPLKRAPSVEKRRDVDKRSRGRVYQKVVGPSAWAKPTRTLDGAARRRLGPGYITASARPPRRLGRGRPSRRSGRLGPTLPRRRSRAPAR